MEFSSFYHDKTLTPFIVAVPVVLVTIVCGLFLSLLILPIQRERNNEYLNTLTVPIIVHDEPNWIDLSNSLNDFHQKIAACLSGLSRQLDMAKLREMTYGGTSLSTSLAKRIDTLSLILHEDSMLLEEILKPFSVIRAITDEMTEQTAATEIDKDDRTDDNVPITNDSTSHPSRYLNELDMSNESSSYDSSMQIVAHIVRDWTVLGRHVRLSTYSWCQHQLQQSPASKILVPGAGLGRLAVELAQDGHSVEANEISLVMAAVINSIINKQLVGTIHPFSLDYFVNEINHDLRNEAVRFPDVSIKDTKGSLSLTLGDFVSTYANTHKQYDAIITCFFIDTATNIYDYLAIIHNALIDGGLWIHVGPLQWHLNAHLHPSVNELKGMVQDLGFTIQQWSIDKEAMDYRMDDTIVRSTKFEGYRPLRVVAMKQSKALPYQIKTLAKTKSNVLKRGFPPSSLLEQINTVIIEEL